MAIQSAPPVAPGGALLASRTLGAWLDGVIREWVKTATDTTPPHPPFIKQPLAFSADMIKGISYDPSQFGFCPTGALLDQLH